jgi:3-oxoacyl-[acyl-carrier-protein] synthase II
MRDIVITGMASLGPGPSTMPEEELPLRVHRVEPFDPDAMFGSRGARFKHRSTLLAMAACEAAIANAGLKVTDHNRDAIGITMGTTAGSVTDVAEFGMSSLDVSRSFVVNAGRLPNMGLNAAASAAAIRLGVRGANTTVAGGPLAGVAALRHAEIILRAGHADVMLAGASEEATGPAVWWARAARATAAVGEGAAVFVLERREAAEAAGRAPVARLGATVLRAVAPTDTTALAEVVSQALAVAGIERAAVGPVAVRATGVRAVDRAQRTALGRLFTAPLLWSEDDMGDCYSAHSALQLARVIAHVTGKGAPGSPDGTTETAEPAGLVVAVDPDGAVGAGVVTAYHPDAVPPSVRELSGKELVHE